MVNNWLETRCWIILGLVVVVLTLVVVTRATLATHMARGYYLGAGVSSYCVLSSVDGAEDERVFCSDDINKVLDVLGKANASLKP